jgi:hypothetical protein
MKDYKSKYCIEGDYFTCPDTMPPVCEEKREKKSGYNKIKFSTDKYRKSIVTKKTYKLYEK